MSRKNFSVLDANIFLRYLLWDDEPKAARCHALFRRLEQGQDAARVLDLTLAEVVWTLQKRFGINRRRIRDFLRPLLEFRGLKLADKPVMLRALDVFAEEGVDFPDAYLAEVARTLNVPVYSYDRDLTALKARRREP
jgi:predicted nucleic acid-binding protein